MLCSQPDTVLPLLPERNALKGRGKASQAKHFMLILIHIRWQLMSHLHKLLCKLVSLLKLIFESSVSSPRLIIYRNQTMTPPGRWLEHINASTKVTANNGTTSGRNEYSIRHLSLRAQTWICTKGIYWCKTMCLEWVHLYTILHRLLISSTYSWAANLHSFWNWVLLVHFWRHCSIYQNEDLITCCSDKEYLFYQDVWNDCFSFVIMLFTPGWKKMYIMHPER